MLSTSDIIQLDGNIWITEEYLVNAGIDYGYLRVAKNRGKKPGASSWQCERIANRTYFLYNTLTPTATALLATPEELKQQASEIQSDTTSIVKRAVFSSFKLFLNTNATEEEAIARAVVHETNAFIKRNNLSFRKSPFFKEMCAEIKLHGVKHLPVNWRNFRDKVEAYNRGEQADDLIRAKNVGNNNRLKFADNDTLNAWLVDLGESGKNYSAATIWRKVNQMCATHGMDAPSDRWIRNWLSLPETQYKLQSRYGSGSRFNQKYRAYTPTKSALYAGDCWDIDGTRVQLISHSAKVKNKVGKEVTANKYLYVIAVRDVMSGDILGWEYCYSENEHAVTNAVAMAVRTAGYLPYEIRYDRFPGHNTEAWLFVEDALRKQGVAMTQTTKPEGKAGLERWWGTLQDVFMPDSDLYYGQGIRSTRRHAHRSKEYVAQMNTWARKNNFNFNDACNEFDQLLAAHASTPYSAYSRKFKKVTQSPQELHDACSHPNTYEVTDHLYAFIFGIRKEVSIRNYMILTQINNAPYYYGIDDVEVCERYTGVKLWNCFDPENLDVVHLYNVDKHLGSFSRIEPAQQYGPDKDMRAVGKVKAINEKVKAHRAKLLAEAKEFEDDSELDDLGEAEILLGGRIPKSVYENAESSILLNDTEEDEGDNLDINHYEGY